MRECEQVLLGFLQICLLWTPSQAVHDLVHYEQWSSKIEFNLLAVSDKIQGTRYIVQVQACPTYGFLLNYTVRHRCAVMIFVERLQMFQRYFLLLHNSKVHNHLKNVRLSTILYHLNPVHSSQSTLIRFILISFSTLILRLRSGLFTWEVSNKTLYLFHVSLHVNCLGHLYYHTECFTTKILVYEICYLVWQIV